MLFGKHDNGSDRFPFVPGGNGSQHLHVLTYWTHFFIASNLSIRTLIALSIKPATMKNPPIMIKATVTKAGK
jgi:hypothetical protein